MKNMVWDWHPPGGSLEADRCDQCGRRPDRLINPEIIETSGEQTGEEDV